MNVNTNTSLLELLAQSRVPLPMLAESPYFLHIEEKPPYILFKTTKFSDLTYLACKQANGCIVRQEDKYYRFVCFPNLCATKPANWREYEVWQLIDGLPFTVWCDRGQWHFSSPHHIDLRASYPLVYEEILKVCGETSALTSCLSPFYCYNFILTSPNFQYIENYGPESRIWYSHKCDLSSLHILHDVPIFQSKCYPIHFFPNFDISKRLKVEYFREEGDCGFVIKNPQTNEWFREEFKEYRDKKRIRGEAAIDAALVVRLWKSDKLKTFMDTFNFPILTQIKETLDLLVNESMQKYRELSTKYPEKVSFTMAIQQFPLIMQKYFLARFTKQAGGALTYYKKVPTKELVEAIENTIGPQFYGVNLIDY